MPLWLKKAILLHKISWHYMHIVVHYKNTDYLSLIAEILFPFWLMIVTWFWNVTWPHQRKYKSRFVCRLEWKSGVKMSKDDQICQTAKALLQALKTHKYKRLFFSVPVRWLWCKFELYKVDSPKNRKKRQIA